MSDERRYLGHYGCYQKARIVCVLPPRNVPQPRFGLAFKLTCPACGFTHVVKPQWRRASERERRKSEHVLLAKEAI